MSSPVYLPRRAARSLFVTVRGLRYHLLAWGDASMASPERPPLLLMHGWMDVAASFQFMVDALATDRCVLAADWRGFGLSDAAGSDGYWFADYLGDLDALLDHPELGLAGRPIDLLGHSMGGNVVMLYAGIRPERIRRLVNLEGFGMPATRSDKAPKRYAQWMDELKSLHRGELALKSYADADGVARRLMKTNPRLPEDKARWLARQWARPNAQGQWEILGDAAHKIVNAQLYRVDEVLATFAAITAPVLSVEASDNQMEQWWQGKYTLAEFHERLKSVPQLQQAKIENAGHMLHHDQPEQRPALIENLLA